MVTEYAGRPSLYAFCTAFPKGKIYRSAPWTAVVVVVAAVLVVVVVVAVTMAEFITHAVAAAFGEANRADWVHFDRTGSELLADAVIAAMGM